MDYIANQEQQNGEMLASLGISTVEDLFTTIPKRLRMPSIQADDGLSEFEGIKHMKRLAAKNSFPEFKNYLGAGAYEHHVPALVQAICSKSEFLTSYTPYQPEASQGMLQAIFEFQSAMCALTGLDVSNASLYDGASACAEALLMAMRVHKNRKKILVAQNVHPHYLKVMEQYLHCHQDISLIKIPFLNNGLIDSAYLEKELDENVAAILIQSPNFFGSMENVKSFFALAKSKKVLSILCANPLSFGLYASAKEVGADICVGDCQPLGLPLQFGGPYAGYMTCKEELVRQIPGRIVGETVDSKGKRGFVLTLQAREQHIRREKATSNICTNQALAALASLVTILWYGKNGLKKLALTNFQRASYLQKKLLELFPDQPFAKTNIFNEFVISFPNDAHKIFMQHEIMPGIDLERYFPKLKNSWLIAVTETKSKQDLDHFIEVAKKCKKI